MLHDRGRRDIKAVLIGGGPELPRVRRARASARQASHLPELFRTRRAGALAAADIGAAPFDVSAHAPLQREFYWSPLKIFEYMASALPVVAPQIDRLAQIVSDGREGLLYDPASQRLLRRAIDRLADDAGLRQHLGSAARARVVEHYSWESHCRALDQAPCGPHAMRILITTDAFPPACGRQRLEHVRAGQRAARRRARDPRPRDLLGTRSGAAGL